MRDLRSSSNLGLLARMTFDTFVADGHGLNQELRENLRRAYSRCLAYAQNPRGWLILKGSYGCGKTHLAAAIANALVERGQAVLFVIVPDLLDHLRSAFAPSSEARFDQRFESVRTAPVLVLDDLGAHSSTPWAQEKLYQLINYRYNAQLPTVITTNQDLEELDPRVRSRMSELEWSEMIHILAPDYRASAVVEQSELSSLSLHAHQTFEQFSLREDDPNMDAAMKANLKRAVQIARNFAQTPHDWLTLVGDYGCGKTHLAAAIANYRVQNGYPALFVVVPDLLDHLRAAFGPHSTVGFDRRFAEIRNAALLVLDDLGTLSATPWAREKLFQVFDYRYNARLPTVITLSHDVDLDARLKTRLLDANRSQVWEITASTFRGVTRPTPPRRPTSSPPRKRGLGMNGLT